MPKKVPASKASSTDALRMLFLAGHGLQSPISSIRWGAGRLKKAQNALSEEQQSLVDGIYDNAKTLSKIVDAMLLLAKVEQGAYEQARKPLYLHDFLTAYDEPLKGERRIAMTLHCSEDIVLPVDRTVFEMVIQSLFLTILTSTKPPHVVSIRVRTTDDRCNIHISAQLELSLLKDVLASKDAHVSSQLVGGVAGLMLSVSSALSAFIGGKLSMKPRGKGAYEIVLSLPFTQ